MKKLLIWGIAAGMMLSLTACQKSASDNGDKGVAAQAENSADGEFQFTDPVTVIVPFTAGGAGDQIARLVQPYLEKQLGASVVIEN